MSKKRRRQLSCRDFMRMPLCEAVLEHVKACPSCRALVNELANDLDLRAYGREHRN
jgi:predicted anti-sigma-YlaC factor YlaD